MTISFTEQELEWINKKKFHWEVKEGCPPEIRRTLQFKLDQFYNGEHYGNGIGRRKDH